MKKQRGTDTPDHLGQMPAELTTSVELSYPDGLETGHYYDPLQPLVGPINVTPQPQAKKKKKKPVALGPLSADQVQETRERRARYDTYIDKLVKFGGDVVLALSVTYGVESDEIRANLSDYRADVATGMSTSSVSDLLEAADIGKAARIGVLRKHVYDPDSKVSLVALKLATDLDGDKHDRGTTYETYLRTIMGRE